MCAEEEYTNIHELKTHITESINRKIHYYIEDLNIPLSMINRSSKQNFRKGTDGMNSTINQFDLIDINKIIYQTAAEYTILLKLTGIIHPERLPLDHKTFLNKFKRTTITQSVP